MCAVCGVLHVVRVFMFSFLCVLWVACGCFVVWLRRLWSVSCCLLFRVCCMVCVVCVAWCVV